VFFRGQSLTLDQHDAFARKFGETNTVRFVKTVPGYPNMSEVGKEEDGTKNIGGLWHTDGSFQQAPPWGSVLVARELPEWGGDTLFLNMAAVYDALSDGMKATLSKLKAVHTNSGYQDKSGGDSKLINTDKAGDVAVHPVVVTHPVNGRKCLYVNGGYTKHFVGWTEEESRPLLEYIYKFAQLPEFFCRFHWEEGSVAFWDNITGWHYAVNDYHGQRRLMHRIALKGEPLS
jgi:taurine dioxygenase